MGTELPLFFILFFILFSILGRSVFHCTQGSASHLSMALIEAGIIFYFHIQTVLIGLETSQEIFGLTDLSPGFSYS